MSDYLVQPEQDDVGGDGLPTYEDLAAQKGPNSRFGRWKGWVEKRAAERYLDITPEERARRRERGWGDDSYEVAGSNSQEQPAPSIHPYNSNTRIPSASSTHSHWSGNTVQIPTFEPPSYFPSELEPEPEPETPIPAIGEFLHPAHLKLHNFGSRFLPHAAWPINALLPLMGNRLLLIGHDNGLSVLDMFPSGDPETSSPADAQARVIWEGEGVYQLELLEFQDTGDATPHGVVLALIGSEVDSLNSKERDVIRSIRMYSLSSLTSLARWAVTQKDTKPVDLRRPSNWSPQQATVKKHKHNSSMVKLKLLISDAQNGGEPNCSYPSPSTKRSSVALNREVSTSSSESTWDMVDELPLRWATDYIPLASAGSRLLNSNVLFFELRRNEIDGIRGSSVLAVACKSSILLYETPKGERAFRFVKEFYTPLQPRSLSFVHQRAQETVVRSPSSSSQRSIDESPSRRFSFRPSLDVTRERATSLTPERATSLTPDYGAQLSLFVVFDKKAGLIRLADSCVGEVELYDDSPRDLYSPVGNSPRRSFVREHKGYWLPPTFEQLPVVSLNQVKNKPVYFLTRGKQTHVIPHPIPTPLFSCPPLSVLTWHNPPNQVCHRVCSPPDEPDFLQVIGFGDFGVEVQELPLSVFSKGKGKARGEEPVRAQMDVGGDIGFLCRGGQWDKSHRYLSRADSFMSYSTASTVQPDKKAAESGFYAWCRKDLEDWRIFWVGGMQKDNVEHSDI
ncbi:hypothetical protein DFH11DRAFT_1567213 [Phellopilus nigrolimitatus]|nr:hypothetical protein DFH11DRAFT_1567213 [Phellopilus nigrolimitatus]